MPSRAQKYFEGVMAAGQGAEFLKSLVGSQPHEFESEFLEFKSTRDLDADHLLELWAKALSGFANSEGGVLIFGIDAPRGKAINSCPVTDLEKLTAKLKNNVGKITEPPVPRVEVQPFPDPPGTDTGFVVCFIPPSPWRPHQVRAGGQPGPFYIRVSDSFVPCNYATLRALFAPQTVSIVDIAYQVAGTQRDAHLSTKEVKLAVYLENKGPSTAVEAFVLYRSNSIFPLKYDDKLWAETGTAQGGTALICRRSIHVGEIVDVFQTHAGYLEPAGLRLATEDSRYEISISTRDQAPTRFEIRLSAKPKLNSLTKATRLRD
jgi:hypothetical protein